MWILSIMAVVVQAALLSASPKTVTINGHTFLATISNRVEQKVKGLMFRKELPADSCMIFLYNADAYRPIWMENCRIPLDVIWVNESGK
ncbi:MAG: DUF192 domain-containing protein, partial [Deltaproteobacteria bacterium]